ncbi:recombinase family protein [Bdellovibrio bacteriovorus]|uniref:recombinase family protein n=1 Tax=Bdellovibrio bacteriovorus TaxID=959 RepID=UPI003AA97B0E
MKPKLVTYFRVSTQGQKEDDTIQRQIMTFELQWTVLSKSFELYERVPGGRQEDHYFKDEGYNLEEWKVDTDFHRLMMLIQTECVDAIYVDEENRLFRARSREFRGRVLDLIEQNGVRVITKNGEVSTGSLAMEIVSAVGADDKRAMLRKCHEAKITRLASEGRPPTGRAPFGLHWNKKEKRWELVPEEAHIIRCAVGLSIGKIYEDMPDGMKGLIELRPGGLPDKEVAQALTNAGFTKRITTRSISHGIDYSGVKAIFASDTYRGKIIFKLKKADQVGNPKFKNGKEQRLSYEVSVPRILSDEDWDNLCFKRNQRRKWAKRNVQHEYLCKDLLVCSTCEVPLAARPKDTERFLKREKRLVRYPPTLYYTCARKQKTSGFRCSANKCHSAPLLDDLVWRKISELLESPKRLLDLHAKHMESSENLARVERLHSAVESLRTQLVKLQSISAKLAANVGTGKISLEDYEVATIENKTTQARIKSEIHATGEALRNYGRDQSSALSLVQKSTAMVQHASFQEKRDLLLAIISMIKVSPDGEIDVLIKGGISLQI